MLCTRQDRREWHISDLKCNDETMTMGYFFYSTNVLPEVWADTFVPEQAATTARKHTITESVVRLDALVPNTPEALTIAPFVKMPRDGSTYHSFFSSIGKSIISINMNQSRSSVE